MKECGRGAPSPARTLMIHRAAGENNKRMDKNHLQSDHLRAGGLCQGAVRAAHRPSDASRTAILQSAKSSCTDWVAEPSAEVL